MDLYLLPVTVGLSTNFTLLQFGQSNHQPSKEAWYVVPRCGEGGGGLRQAEHDTDAQSWIRFFGGVESPLLPHRLLSLSMPPP